MPKQKRRRPAIQPNEINDLPDDSALLAVPMPDYGASLELPQLQPELFINRELSWLEFNQRVLNEALDPHVPLLERLKFLAISSTNLDEFHRVRVGTLNTLAAGNVSRTMPSGLTPHQQLLAVRAREYSRGAGPI